MNHHIEHSPHPRGFWPLMIASAFSNFSFGFLLANLMQYFHSIDVSIAKATVLFAVFISILYALPFIGGYLADKFGFKIAIVTGMSLNIIGSLLVAVPMIYSIEVGLSFYVVGACLSAATMTGLVGLQYKKIPYKRESGMSLSYAVLNGGYLIAGLLGAFLVKLVGYDWSIAIFTLANVFALTIFLASQRVVIGMHPGSDLNVPLKKLGFYAAYVVFGVLLCFAAFRHPIIDSILFWIILVGCFAYLFLVAIKSYDVKDKKQTFAFAILCLIGVAYNVIYNTEFEILPYFFTSSINTNIGPWSLPNDLVAPLDPIYCVILAPLTGALWAYLARRKRDLSLPTKFGLGLILASSGYFFLAIVLSFSMQQRLPAYMLLVSFFVFVLGELLVVPIAYAMAPKLAPRGKVGIFSAIWTVMNGFAAVIGGYMASSLAVNLKESLLLRNEAYREVFLSLAIVVMVIGLAFYIFIRPFVKRMIA